MIVSFRDAETKRIFEGRHSKKLPFDIQRTARRKLLSLAASVNLADLAALPGNRFERLKDDRKANTAFESMISGEFVSSGETPTPNKSKSWITTKIYEQLIRPHSSRRSPS